MKYDGSGKLAEAIANLFGLSKKSQAQIAQLIKQAKNDLAIAGNSRRMPDDIKMAIYQWHYDRLNPVQNVKQPDEINQELMPDSDIQDIKQELSQGANVQDIKQAGDFQLHQDIIQDIKQIDSDNQELLPEIRVYDVKQDDIVQNVKSVDDDRMQGNVVYDFKQIHFAVSLASKRTTIMLEGYLVKALQRKHGLHDNTAIRLWLEQAITNDSQRFDSNASLTRQGKRLIIESLI
jgi:hypothetical protein